MTTAFRNPKNFMTTKTHRNKAAKGGSSLPPLAALETSDVRWEYEDELPEMEDADFDAIFPSSRVLGMECGGVRMYPYVEDSSGNRIWITHLPSEPNAPAMPTASAEHG